ncbi:unnamed protein product [Pylaiella littoralis]
MMWLAAHVGILIPISATAFSLSNSRGTAFSASSEVMSRVSQATSRYRNGWTSRPAGTLQVLSMSFGAGATNRYSWDETDKEVNVKARLPAWAKGKSVVLDLTQTGIKLSLKEEEGSPIIEGSLRGAITLDGSYWTMETLDDNGKMLYLTLEKAPQLTGLGPWMGVVQGEKQVDSNYPEEEKAAEIASMARDEKESQGAQSGGPRYTGVVDEDGFCRDLLAVQGMSGAMVARQVPVNGNALFSAVAMSRWFIESGEHSKVSSPEIEAIAKDLRQKTLDYLTGAYKANDQIYLSGEQMAARPFVASQAKANGMADGDEYLKAMRDDTMWGGGGEVVGLTHVLKRPIHVYDLVSTGRRFGLRVIGRFGAPRYSAEKPIHIVSTYARFPDLDPGSQSAEGNHYVALYHYEDVPEKNKEKL